MCNRQVPRLELESSHLPGCLSSKSHEICDKCEGPKSADKKKAVANKCFSREQEDVVSLVKLTMQLSNEID